LAGQAVATFTDPGGAEGVGDYSATIDWGDNTLQSGTIVFNSATNTFTVSGGHTYVEEGSYTVTVLINHEDATPQTVTTSVSVADPNVAATGVAVGATEGIPLVGAPVATFTDPGGAEPTFGVTVTSVAANPGQVSTYVTASHTLTPVAPYDPSFGP